MNAVKRNLIRTFGTIGVCGLLWWGLQNPDKGFLREIGALGPIVAGLVAVGFLGLVLAYARDLSRLLQAVPEHFRAARPASVWWMLAIPFNFTEDFFIIANIAKSLERAAPALPDKGASFGRFGRISGFGWCALQIGSLVPHDIGSIAGLLALPLWLWHWRFVRKAQGVLSQLA